MACLATREHFSAYAEGTLAAAKRDLLSAYRRGAASGNLADEVRAYADQRVHQLR